MLQNLTKVENYMTQNNGFDTLRMKNAKIAICNGFDVMQAVEKTLKHSTIKEYRAEKLIKVEVIGCNLVIFTVDDMEVKNKVRAILSSIWAVHTPTFYQKLTTSDYDVNQVINDRLTYLPTASKNILRQKAKKYTRAFVAGLDIIPQDVMDRVLGKKLNKTRTTKEKRETWGN